MISRPPEAAPNASDLLKVSAVAPDINAGLARRSGPPRAPVAVLADQAVAPASVAPAVPAQAPASTERDGDSRPDIDPNSGLIGPTPAVATPAAATPLEPPAILPAAPAPTAPAAPLASWSLPVPAGCPTPNMLAPGENRIAGEVRGEAICRLLIPADTASRVTLVGPGPALPDLKVVLYSRTTTDLAADQPLPVPPGRQELRVLRAPQAPGRTPLPFDLLIRLD